MRAKWAERQAETKEAARKKRKGADGAGVEVAAKPAGVADIVGGGGTEPATSGGASSAGAAPAVEPVKVLSSAE